jgi:hypothetical protein
MNAWCQLVLAVAAMVHHMKEKPIASRMMCAKGGLVAIAQKLFTALFFATISQSIRREHRI